ncbi:conserved exported hypothetical protein [Burkholderia sp. 8Y]|uniref:DUF5666 domain-containing protein n=1 Tax=Burkholderia sp. 8Y TaxID=2653133 RepID=UPI0012EF0E18|nr:DUF5666 domain-containing protein [Burkholderia sp. 8Y]VXC79131.1 conserved exported hypothetical protein [Burkholderia sp. 8Y]
MWIRMKLGVSIAALAFTAAAFAQTPAAKPTRIRGDIVAISGDTLTVHRRSGDTVKVTVKADTPVTALRNIALQDIKPGEFVGTAATTGTDGKLTATEVLVFPEAARGTGEGHYAWDLGPQSSMTNANVDQVVQGTSGRDLKLSYKGGSSSITVPENVPVVTFAPATHDDLKPGKKIFVLASPDGGDFAAQRIVVEKGGVVPPM